MKYTIEMHGEQGGCAEVETITGKLAMRRAARVAYLLAAAGSEKVYITWYRASDGQQGYLNRDGHSPVGREW